VGAVRHALLANSCHPGVRVAEERRLEYSPLAVRRHDPPAALEPPHQLRAKRFARS